MNNDHEKMNYAPNNVPPYNTAYQANPPGYQPVPQQPYNASNITVITTNPTENNMLLGFFMGCLFGICGLWCALCVNHKSSYLKGWIIPFIINCLIASVALFFAIFWVLRVGYS
jgi:hypothetical protein